MTEMPDLFGHMPAQASLFGEGKGRMPNPAPVVRMPTPQMARARLRAYLETARAAERMRGMSAGHGRCKSSFRKWRGGCRTTKRGSSAWRSSRKSRG